MLIKPEQLQHWIKNFYGYGSWKAKIWFVGHEEGGGDLPEEVAEKFEYFNKAHRSTTSLSDLCDIQELYKHVSFVSDSKNARRFDNLNDYRFGADAVLHGSWKNLIAFSFGYQDKKLPDLLEYQRKKFANKSEALIQLYPLPASHNHGWYYSWLELPQFPFLKSRRLYEEHVYQDRIQHILASIAKYNPEIVLMYGMNNINELKVSVQSRFQEAKFKMVKAIPQQTPQHHLATLANGTTLLITTQIPALHHRRVETGFDWFRFGRECLSRRSR